MLECSLERYIQDICVMRLPGLSGNLVIWLTPHAVTVLFLHLLGEENHISLPLHETQPQCNLAETLSRKTLYIISIHISFWTRLPSLSEKGPKLMGPQGPVIALAGDETEYLYHCSHYDMRFHFFRPLKYITQQVHTHTQLFWVLDRSLNSHVFSGTNTHHGNETPTHTFPDGPTLPNV